MSHPQTAGDEVISRAPINVLRWGFPIALAALVTVNAAVSVLIRGEFRLGDVDWVCPTFFAVSILLLIVIGKPAQSEKPPWSLRQARFLAYGVSICAAITLVFSVVEIVGSFSSATAPDVAPQLQNLDAVKQATRKLLATSIVWLLSVHLWMTVNRLSRNGQTQSELDVPGEDPDGS